MKWGLFEYDQFEELSKRIDKAVSEETLNKVARNIIRKAAETVIKFAKENTPVDTGWLRRSWYKSNVKIQGKDLVVTIYNNAEYAMFVEFGHRIVQRGVTVGFEDGKFMLTLAIDEMKKLLPEITEKQIKTCFERIFS